MATTDFKELGRRPCPVCGHADRCKSNADGDCIQCFRTQDEHCNGWKRITWSDTGSCTYVRNGSQPRQAENISDLAAGLEVSVASLQALRFELRGGEWANPERTPAGSVSTYVRRCRDGKKRGDKGKPRGLTYPSDWKERPGPVLCVEGASDVAACLDMRLSGVGRPGAKVGAAMLAELLRGRDCIIVGEWEASGDGRKGAESIASKLARQWNKPVRWAMPSEGVKDTRDFLRKRRAAGVSPEDAGREYLAYLEEHAVTVEPTHEPAAEKKATRPERWTQLVVAERTVQEHGADLRFCPALGWFAWDGRRWRPDDTREVMRRVSRTVRGLWKLLPSIEHEEKIDFVRFVSRCETAGSHAGIITLAESLSPVVVRVADLDRDPLLLNCRNGTVDLRTGELREHHRDDLITKVCPVDYDPDGVRPVFDAFLDTTFSRDPSMIGFVRRAIGSAIAGIIREHVLHVLHGVGSNGKTTLLELLLYILGDYGGTAPDGLLVETGNDKNHLERADLFGKRLVVMVETEESGRLKEQVVKRLTGGDTIKARKHYRDFFEFTPTHTLLLATNHRPQIRDTSHGMWRRLHLWPFNVVIPDDKQDRGLPDKLKAEAGAILAWCVGGCIEWLNNGLKPPGTVTAATAGYRQECDSIGQFIDECCELRIGLEERGGRLYAAYSAWQADNGGGILSNVKFSKRMLERGDVTRDETNKTNRVYVGLTLRDEWRQRADRLIEKRLERAEG